MKNIFFLVSFLVLLVSCKSSTDPSPTTSTATSIITGNSWKIDRFASTITGKTLTIADIGAQPFAFQALDFAFLSTNKVRATDRASGQIQNGGTWYFRNSDAIMDFDVDFFKGTFDVVSISKTKLIIKIQQTNALFPKIDNTVNWEFVPSL